MSLKKKETINLQTTVMCNNNIILLHIEKCQKSRLKRSWWQMNESQRMIQLEKPYLQSCFWWQHLKQSLHFLGENGLHSNDHVFVFSNNYYIVIRSFLYFNMTPQTFTFKTDIKIKSFYSISILSYNGFSFARNSGTISVEGWNLLNLVSQ